MNMKKITTILLTGIILTLGACYPENFNQTTFHTYGPVAEKQLDIFWLILAGGVVVFILVEGLLIYSVIKYRRKKNSILPNQVHGNHKLEIIWTIIPAVIVLVFSILSINTLIFAADIPKDSEGNYENHKSLHAIGHQWWFEFRYPNPNDESQQVVLANEVYIPVGIPVKIELEAVDVIHSFWVPKLAGKVDMVPKPKDLNGYKNNNYMWFEASESGVYFGQCAEFCGLSHANMKFKVIAVNPSEYDSWLMSQMEPAVKWNDPLVKEGSEIFKSAGCSGCHSLKPVAKVGSKGRLGPNLTHLASRTHLAAGMLNNTTGVNTTVVNDAYLQKNLRAWITDPASIKPGNIMSAQAAIYNNPDKELTEAQISALVAYLTTLK
jgi:cytochrome c oxidase subunit 2